MTTLLLAEVHNGHLNDATAKALTAAAVNFREKKSRHQSTPASFLSLSLIHI